MYFCFLVLASSSPSSWLTGAVTMISRSICAVLLLTRRRNHNPEEASLTLSFWAPLVIFRRLFTEVNSFTPRLLVRRRRHATKDLPVSSSRALLVPCLQAFVSLASSGSQPNAMVRCLGNSSLAVNGCAVRPAVALMVLFGRVYVNSRKQGGIHTMKQERPTSGFPDTERSWIRLVGRMARPHMRHSNTGYRGVSRK